MNRQPIIRVQGLTYRYPGGAEALRGVDFNLHAGEAVALLGPNGSGKTTFLLHLNGLLSGSGSLSLCGLEPRRENLAEIRRRVGLLFQNPGEQLFLARVIDDVAFGLKQHGASGDEAERRAFEALARVGAEKLAQRTTFHLSAGEQQRVALAGVLAMEPEVLALDEPTTHLDPHGRAKLVELLKNLPQAKVLVTHDVSFARALAQRAVFFTEGRAIADGLIDDIIEQFGWGGQL